MFKALLVGYAAVPVLAAMAYSQSATSPVATALVGNNVSRTIVSNQPATCGSSCGSVFASESMASSCCASKSETLVAETSTSKSCCSGGVCPMSGESTKGQMADDASPIDAEAALTLASVTAAVSAEADGCPCGQCEAGCDCCAGGECTCDDCECDGCDNCVGK